MSRAKSHSSKFARIRDLVNNLSGELDPLQAEYDELLQDQARLKEIEPALLKLQNTLNPPPKQPEVPPTDEPAVTEQTAVSDQPEKPKRQRARKDKSTDEQDEQPQ